METSTLPPKNDAPWWATLSPNLLAKASDEDFELIEAAIWDEVDGKCGTDPLFWLQEMTCTENPKAAQQGLEYRAHFPVKTYFAELFKAFTGQEPYAPSNPEKPRLAIPKTREMMTSWAAIGYGTWRAQWHRWEVIVQTEAELKAYELVDYAHQLYRNQEQPLKDRHPLEAISKQELKWKDGGRLLAIPKGADKIRLYHPTLYIMDEASFLPEAQQCYDNAHPVSHQIIAISSAGPGWFGNECAK